MNVGFACLRHLPRVSGSGRIRVSPGLLLASALARSIRRRLPDRCRARHSFVIIHLDLVRKRRIEELHVSAEASEMVSIPRAELEALQAELRRLRREVGRGMARARMQADPGPGDDALVFTRGQLAEAWGISE